MPAAHEESNEVERIMEQMGKRWWHTEQKCQYIKQRRCGMSISERTRTTVPPMKIHAPWFLSAEKNKNSLHLTSTHLLVQRYLLTVPHVLTIRKRLGRSQAKLSLTHTQLVRLLSEINSRAYLRSIGETMGVFRLPLLCVLCVLCVCEFLWVWKIGM